MVLGNRLVYVSMVATTAMFLSSMSRGNAVAINEGKQGPSWRVRGSRLQGNEKIIHFVRHAEGHHNVAGKKDPVNGYLNYALIDAELTEEGIQQCVALRDKVQDSLSTAQLVVVSPMNRTIKTAQHCFPKFENKVPWIALEDIRERTGRHWCDKRHSLTKHKASYPNVNFDHVTHDEDPLFHLYTGREPNADIIQRGKNFVEWLANRPEKEIIVVSHSGFLTFLLSDVMQLENADETTKFDNCELRSFIVSFEK